MTNDFPVFLEEGKNTQFWYNYREYDHKYLSKN